MKRYVVGFVLALLLSLSIVTIGTDVRGAAVPVGGCPPGFNLVAPMQKVIGEPDVNGDGLVCEGPAHAVIDNVTPVRY